MEAITNKITPEQQTQLNRFMEDFLRKLNLSKDEAQELVEKFNALKPDLEKVFRKHAISDQRFGPAVKEFDVVIPLDFNHTTCIDDNAEKVKKLKTTYYYNDVLTSKNFPNPTHTLVPGKTYTVKLIPILGRVTSDDCLAHLAKQNAILVGGQGLTVIDTAQLPKGKWYVSFDTKENLWKDFDRRHRVPSVLACVDGDFSFSLGSFEGDWDGDNCLLCFCDKSA